MKRAGSIISVDITCDVNVVGSGDTLNGEVRVNNSAVFTVELAALKVAEGLNAVATQVLGVDTFVAGDYLWAARILTGASPGQVTTDDLTISVEVGYN